MENNETKVAEQSAESAVDTQKQPLDYEKEFKALSEKYNSLNNDYIRTAKANDKLSSENADWKRKYNSTLSDVEKERIANEEREAHYREIERQYNLGKISGGLSKSISDEKVVNDIANKLLDNDNFGAVEELNKYFAQQKEVITKQVKEQLLRDNPTPPATNANAEGDVTKQQFDRMSYAERKQLRDKDPELYDKLAN